jgi:hypothetical protein
MNEGVANSKRLKAEMGGSSRLVSRIVALLILLSLVAGCGGAIPEADSQVSPLAPPVTLAPTATLPPTLAPTATLPPVPIQLTILHTNDNWGETEPCG